MEISTKRTKVSAAQIVSVRKQADDGTPVGEVGDGRLDEARGHSACPPMY